MRNFMQFLLDSSINQALAGEFWERVSKPDFTTDQVKDFLNAKGYSATDRDLHKIGRIRDKVDQEYNCFDKDY